MIHIAICDTNKNDIISIQKYITKYMKNRAIHFKINVFMSGEALLEADDTFELVFLAVVMVGISGIEAGKKLRKTNKCVKIIYITSFLEYWIQAINQVHAFAYLQKPINMKDISIQMEEVLRDLDREFREIPVIGFEIVTAKDASKADSIFMNFSINDIYYFEYAERKIIIKTREKEYYYISQMKYVIQKMKKYWFACCHQSFLVILQYVESIKGYDLYMKNGDTLPVSQKKSSEFRSRWNRFLHKDIQTSPG